MSEAAYTLPIQFCALTLFLVIIVALAVTWRRP